MIKEDNSNKCHKRISEWLLITIVFTLFLALGGTVFFIVLSIIPVNKENDDIVLSEQYKNDYDGIISKEISPDGILTLTEYDGKITCECDLDRDGKNEIISADYSETLKDHQLPINMTIMKSNEEDILWQDISLGLPSAGWKSYYITVVDGSPYLIEYHPPEERQGLYYYSCKVFTIDSNGNEIIHADISGNTEEAVDAFNTEISQYMDNAYPFISTLNGNITTSRIILRGEQ